MTRERNASFTRERPDEDEWVHVQELYPVWGTTYWEDFKSWSRNSGSIGTARQGCVHLMTTGRSATQHLCTFFLLVTSPIISYHHNLPVLCFMQAAT